MAGDLRAELSVYEVGLGFNSSCSMLGARCKRNEIIGEFPVGDALRVLDQH